MNINGIIEKFNGDLSENKPLPFWSWNGNLKKERLVKQIEWMNDNGIGGYFMHARSGLKTEYLSKEWMNCIKACAEYGNNKSLESWIYDENGWPSGFAGGKLLEDENNRDKYITYKFGCFDNNAVVSYKLENNNLIRKFDNNGGEYLNLYIETAVSTTDILNPAVTDKFIALTHEKYKKEFGEDFSNKITGFFTDEPQYQRMHTAFTPIIVSYYKEKYNEDIYDKLGLLFVEAKGYKSFRYRYWSAMQHLMIENFARRLHSWCTDNGVKLTGHYIEETTLFGQMMCCAGVMPFYVHMDIPGIDWLGSKADNEIPPRQVASVAAQYLKKQVLTETFAGCGWNMSPKDLKRIADFQFCCGVNRLCHHLVPYSEQGRRKRDYPPHFSNINPWVEYEFRDFNKYFTKLGFLLSHSEEFVNVAVLHPIREAYLYFKRDEETCLDDLSEKLLRTCRLLSSNGISYHFLDETLLEKDGFVNGNKIGCAAKEYEFLILPNMSVLAKSTEKLIKKYLSNRGKILILGNKPQFVEGENFDFSYLNTNCTLEDIFLSQPYRVKNQKARVNSTYRVIDNVSFLFVMNPTEEIQTQEYDFGMQIKSFEELNIVNDEISAKALKVELAPGEAAVLFPSGRDYCAQNKPVVDLKIKNADVVFERNYLPIDFLQYSFDGVNFSELYSTVGLFSKLLEDRYEGNIFLKYCFEIDEKPSALSLAIENSESTEYFLNGEKIIFSKCSKKEENLIIADISENALIGVNEFVAKTYWYQDEKVYYALFGENVTEGLKNCLVYNSEIEPIYLLGDFGVYSRTNYRPGLSESYVYAENFYIGKKPTVITEPTTEGFPFFAGKILLKQVITLESKNVCIRFKGTWHAAYLRINGAYAGKMVYNDTVDISPYANLGENCVEIELIIGNRNLLGPHHNNINENDSGGLFAFELYGTWKEGKSEFFSERYNLLKVFE